jgi:hypothetical protein
MTSAPDEPVDELDEVPDVPIPDVGADDEIEYVDPDEFPEGVDE